MEGNYSVGDTVSDAIFKQMFGRRDGDIFLLRTFEHVDVQCQKLSKGAAVQRHIPFNLKVGYHNEHHDFPNVAWGNLPKVPYCQSARADTHGNKNLSLAAWHGGPRHGARIL